MATWNNNDGLIVYYGSDEAALAVGGEYKTFGLERIEEFELNLVNLTEVEAVVGRIIFPKGKVLSKVVVITDAVAATGVAIDIGVISREASPSVNSPQGILAAFPTASMSSLGETTEFWEDTSIPLASAAFGGALIGTVVSPDADVPVNITASRTTATAFTTGYIKVQLHWYKSNVR